jgi:cobalt-zinc-cadmium efflux system membrane fusion protein
MDYPVASGVGRPRPALARAVPILGAMACVIASGCGGKGRAAPAAAPAAASAAHADADTGDAGKAQDAAGGDDDEASVPPVVGAHTAVVARQAFRESLTAIGVVAPRPGHYAELAPAAAARVARIFVVPGDHVHAGDSLVEFERAPFDAAAASADAALTMAQHAYDRAQRLAAAGIAARKDVDQAAADLASARSTDVAAQRAQQLATLRAPFSGVVTRLSAVLGATADPGQPVASIADPNALDLVFSLSATEAARVRPGATVTITSGQGVRGDALGEAVVSTVGAALDTATRTVAIRARLTHPARVLRIGETIFGRIDVGVRRDAATVPVQALVPDGDGLKVFVVGADGIAHARAVVVGGRTETTAEIVDGVHPGETVVTDGAYGVEDRAKVVPVR